MWGTAREDLRVLSALYFGSQSTLLKPRHPLEILGHRRLTPSAAYKKQGRPLRTEAPPPRTAPFFHCACFAGLFRNSGHPSAPNQGISFEQSRKSIAHVSNADLCMRTQVARYSASAAAASDATTIAAAAIPPEVGVAILRDARRPQHGNYSAAGNNKHLRARWQPLAPATLSSGGLCRGPCITTRQHNFPTPRRPRIFRVGAKSRGYTTTLQNMHPARRLPLPALPPFSSGGLLPSSSRCNVPPIATAAIPQQGGISSERGGLPP